MGLFNWKELSPFGPLGEHMRQVRACVDLVQPMFECVRDGDYDRLQTIAEKIYKTEHEADQIKARIRETIPKVFSLPVYRGDLLAYLHVQDEIADSVEDIAVTLTLKRLQMPAGLSDEIFAYVRSVLDVCAFLDQATENLRDLAETDFEGPHAAEVLKIIDKAEHAEWQADKAQYRVSQKLFALDDQMKATDIFLWSGVFQELGRLANHADKSAERLRRMLTR